MTAARSDDDPPIWVIRTGIIVASLTAFAVMAALVWNFLPPPLPKTVRLGTGPAGGHYAKFGEMLREQLSQHGIALELVTTAGSIENIRLLEAEKIDVGLVQSGNLRGARASEFESVAALFYEPVLVVESLEWEAKNGLDVAGGRIAIGRPGSGANALARELLNDQGVSDGAPPGTLLVEIGEEEAVAALSSGEVDSGIFVTTLNVDWARDLFTNPRFTVTQFALAEAFTRHYRYLKSLSIPAGLIDLRNEIPSENLEIIATTASLVIRPGAHHALIPLLIESASDLLRRGTLLAAPDEFPSPNGVDAPIAADAQRIFDRGPSFFYRWLPFRYAFAATRLTFVLLPMLTLLYPLYRSAGPLYRWAIQRRVYRWYRVLRKLERQLDTEPRSAGLAELRSRLDRVGEEIRATRTPARYGASLFALRAHHLQIQERLSKREEQLPETDSEQ